MYKGTYESTNKGLGFKLINSMSFGESVISAGLFQKTVKGDLFVKRNQGIVLQHIHGKVLEDTRGHHAEAGLRGRQVGSDGPTPMPPGTPWCPSPPSSGMFLHRLLRLHPHHSLSWFDPRAHVRPSGHKSLRHKSFGEDRNPNHA
jgi:hypothetical protein